MKFAYVEVFCICEPLRRGDISILGRSGRHTICMQNVDLETQVTDGEVKEKDVRVRGSNRRQSCQMLTNITITKRKGDRVTKEIKTSIPPHKNATWTHYLEWIIV